MANVKDNNGVFIGARVLTENQIKLIVPTFDTIMEQIEEIRTEAERVKEEKRTSQYNNAIGLFGARGTGKTSTILTIKNKLIEDKHNIILDTIEPDTFGGNTKIMGAIIGMFKDVLEKMEDYIKNEADKDKYGDFFCDCRFKKNNKLRKRYEEMLEAYCYTEGEYRKLLTKDFTDMETFKKKYSEVLKPDIELSKKIEKFYDELVRVKRIESKKEPLIVLFIDDVDLKTSKCKEIIDAMMKYTCHPNVVCILSGDYEILNESITLSLLESEKLAKDFEYAHTEIFKDSKVMDGEFSLLDRKKYLTHEYLKKILPPAFRHNVVTWNLSNIPKFSFEIKEGEKKKNVYFYEKLTEVFGENSIFSPIKNNQTDMVELIRTPYNIFDTTPRGLVNVYYYLDKFNKENFENDELKERRFIYIKMLIDTIIDSSKELVRNKEFINKCLLWGNNENTTLINFEHITNELIKGNEYIHISKEKDNDKDIKLEKDRRKVVLNTFLLCYIAQSKLDNAKCEGYENAKKAFIYAMYKDNWYVGFAAQNGNLTFGSFNNYWRNDSWNLYNNCIRELLKFTDLTFALKFYEKFVDEMEGADIYIKTSSSEEVNKKVFNVIYDILFLTNESYGKEVLSNWYNMNQYQMGKMDSTLKFLDELSRTNTGYEVTERIFKDISINIDIYKKSIKNQTNENDSEIEYGITKSFRDKSTEYNRYFKNVILNRFTEIRKNHEGFKSNSIDEEIAKNNIKLIKMLKKVSKFKEEDKFRINKILLNRTIQISNDLSTILLRIENKDNIITINEFKAEFQKFMNGNAGVSDTTIYNQVKSNIDKLLGKIENNAISIDVDRYIKLMKELDYLAYRSNARYGIFEARELFGYIKENAILTTDMLDKYNFSEALHEYSNYIIKEKNEELIEGDYSDKKEKMRTLLKEVYNKVKDEDDKLLKELGMDPEDMENSQN
ncbi:hypothetical protein [Oceanirhabdus sp. W0125-5]|uniref:hypothetical protein n=1 Tax=Oceanirhabdus sp. W0125-5 TaxID=2999116 RepID=UPI0022F2B9B5|nr:hypothetical protein [Oceanirhabdus sp. W0125-5]WBW96311.1 hypothetical protein OW730_21845 [Oceanirhabdus sp. W0125-5]